MSSSSRSSSPFAFSSHELGHIVIDNVLVNQINKILNNTNNVTAAAHLCHFGFIVTTITHLEYTLDQCQEEKLKIFTHMMENEPFWNALRPFFRDHRQQTRRSGFHPYTRHPLTPKTPSPPSSKSPSDNSSSFKYKTADDAPGSPQNPINIDQFDQEAYDNKKFQEMLAKNQMPPQFKPTCEQCNQIGHEKPDCDTPIHSFVHCNVCEFFNQKQSMYCEHYDLSPVSFRRLRGNIPYDDSN